MYLKVEGLAWSSVAKTPSFQCRGFGINPWSGKQILHAKTKEKGIGTHSSILAWRISGTEEPGGLPSMGSHRVGHDGSNLAVAAAAAIKTNIDLEQTINYLNPPPLPLGIVGWEPAILPLQKLKAIHQFQQHIQGGWKMTTRNVLDSLCPAPKFYITQ